jgi:hypothetical protein
MWHVRETDELHTGFWWGDQSSSSLARQPLVGPDLPKKLCPFVSVEGDFLPILDP